MSQMTVDQLIELEIMVRETIANLEKEIRDAEDHGQPPGQLDGTEGRLSRQDSLMRHQIDKEAQRRRHQRLRLLNESLQRMDSGEYGICSNCDGEIEYARLELQPEATLCSSCANRNKTD